RVNGYSPGSGRSYGSSGAVYTRSISMPESVVIRRSSVCAMAGSPSSDAGMSNPAEIAVLCHVAEFASSGGDSLLDSRGDHLVGGDEPLVDGLLDEPVRQLPQLRERLDGGTFARQDPGRREGLVCMALPAGKPAHDHRVQGVDRSGKSRLDRHLCLELAPERVEVLVLVLRQHSHQALTGGLLTGVDIVQRHIVPQYGVASKDLDEIVDHQQITHMVVVGALRRGILKQHGEQRCVPDVLGDRLLTRLRVDPVRATRLLEAVC